MGSKLLDAETDNTTGDWVTVNGGVSVFVTGLVNVGAGVTIEVATAEGDPKSVATLFKDDPVFNCYSPGPGDFRIRAKSHGLMAGDAVTVEINDS